MYCRRGGAPRGRGGRGASREGWSGRGREFERHSGTGRGKEISKDGGGSRNWGSNADAVKLGDAPDAAAAPEGAPSADAAASPAEDVAPPEPEEVVLTLEDVEKARLAKRSGELFATQKEDTTKLLAQFKGAKKVDRDQLDDEDAFLSGKLYGAKISATEAEEKEAADKGVSICRASVPRSPPSTPRRGLSFPCAGLADLLAFNYGGRGPRADGGGEITGGDRSERGRGGFRGGRGGARDGDRSDRPPREGGECLLS